MARIAVLSLLFALFAAIQLSAAPKAHAAETANWLPLKGTYGNAIGCTWSNGCEGGYHTSNGKAIDFAVPYYTPVYSAGPGTVVGFNNSCNPSSPNPNCAEGRGRYVEISHSDGRHSRYLHLSNVVKTSGSVSRGELIGYTGLSGNTNFNHLHYDELDSSGTKVDPGPMYAMHGSEMVSYPGVLNKSNWSAVSSFGGHQVRNDAYGFTPQSPASNVKKVIKTTDTDGTHLVYTATPYDVYESWWRNGGDGVHTTSIIRISQGNIVDADKVIQADGKHSLYTAVTDGIWETWWRPGEGLHHNKIINLSNVKKVVVDNTVENGQVTYRLYVLANDGPYEYWWRDGQSIQGGRLVNINNPVAMLKTRTPSGQDQVFTATPGAVFETTWGGGSSLSTRQVIGISQLNIVDIAKQNLSDGTQLLYTATSVGVWESKWVSGGTTTHSNIVTNQTNVKRVEKRMDSAGNHQLYVATSDRVQEYWWRTGASGSSTLINASSINDFERSTDGSVQTLYTSAGPNVYETYWGTGDGLVHTNEIISLD